MSPGATFERVYNELKRMLAEGELPPGTPIEPALIGRQIASSITPIRDALHRLTGERLVEAPNHNGFRVPLLTESALRDLYNWNRQLLSLAARNIHPLPSNENANAVSPGDVTTETASMFVELARETGSAEHVRAIQQLNDRLTPFRRVEGQVLAGVFEECDALLLHRQKADRAQLVSRLERYHRRRLRAVPELLASVHTAAVSTP